MLKGERFVSITKVPQVGQLLNLGGEVPVVDRRTLGGQAGILQRVPGDFYLFWDPEKTRILSRAHRRVLNGYLVDMTTVKEIEKQVKILGQRLLIQPNATIWELKSLVQSGINETSFKDISSWELNS